MIVVKLAGGLGNQLFQYAAGRWLSVLHRTELKLDTRALDADELRRYSLAPFRILEEFASPEDIGRVLGSSRKGLERLAFRFAQKARPYYRRSIFREARVGPFDPNIVRTPKDVYLDGYWQSNKYFAAIEDLIRREFTIKEPLGPTDREIARRITNAHSVSVHVRRQDYVSNPKVHEVHGTCTRDYYRKCVQTIAARVPGPHCFVFGDDPDWAEANLPLGEATTFVTHNSAVTDYQDLRLMSLCRHHIIANSSFSWWGAWLSDNPNKIVLAPREWFADPTRDATDLLPARWARL